MYAIFSGKTVVDDQSDSKDAAIERAKEIVLERGSGSHRPPRAVTIVGIKGSAKRAKPVEVVVIGASRLGTVVRAA